MRKSWKARHSQSSASNMLATHPALGSPHRPRVCLLGGFVHTSKAGDIQQKGWKLRPGFQVPQFFICPTKIVLSTSEYCCEDEMREYTVSIQCIIAHRLVVFNIFLPSQPGMCFPSSPFVLCPPILQMALPQSLARQVQLRRTNTDWASSICWALGVHSEGTNVNKTWPWTNRAHSLKGDSRERAHCSAMW